MNYLVVPITVTIDGVAVGSVPGSAFSPGIVDFTVSSSAHSIRYVPSAFTYSNGTPVPADFSGEAITLASGDDVALNVNNLIQGQPFIAFRVVNTSHATIQVGLVRSGQVTCLGSLPDVAGQTYGYYALTATTEVRAYAAASNCSGAFRVWSNATLSTYEANTGYITLSAVP